MRALDAIDRYTGGAANDVNSVVDFMQSNVSLVVKANGLLLSTSKEC